MSSSVLWRRWRFVATRSSRAFIASPPKKATLIRTGTHPSKEHVPSSGAPLALPVIKYNNADEGIPASVSERKVSLWKKITSVNQTIKALTSKLDGGVENPFYGTKPPDAPPVPSLSVSRPLFFPSQTENTSHCARSSLGCVRARESPQPVPTPLSKSGKPPPDTSFIM